MKELAWLPKRLRGSLSPFDRYLHIQDRVSSLDHTQSYKPKLSQMPPPKATFMQNMKNTNLVAMASASFFTSC